MIYLLYRKNLNGRPAAYGELKTPGECVGPWEPVGALYGSRDAALAAIDAVERGLDHMRNMWGHGAPDYVYGVGTGKFLRRSLRVHDDIAQV